MRKTQNCILLLAGVAMWAPSAAIEDVRAGADAKPDVAATIGGEPVTMAELDAKVLKNNMKLAQELYNARKAALDQVILDRLLGKEASEKGTTVEKLLIDKVKERAKPVTDADVEAYHTANATKMKLKPLDQSSGQIRNQLTATREAEARDAILTELKAKTEVKLVMSPPRANVTVAANDPVKGPANAKITIVEFSEFQ